MAGRATIRFLIAFFAVLLALHSFFAGSQLGSGGVTSNNTNNSSSPGWFFFSGGGGGSSGWDNSGGRGYLI